MPAWCHTGAHRHVKEGHAKSLAGLASRLLARPSRLPPGPHSAQGRLLPACLHGAPPVVLGVLYTLQVVLVVSRAAVSGRSLAASAAEAADKVKQATT